MNFLQCNNSSRAIRADARRVHLLDVARNLFVERGFHRTGIAQIAEASGVGVGQIYHDFASKEDIIAAIVERDIAAFLNEECLARSIRERDHKAVRHWITDLSCTDEPIEDCRMMTEILAEIARNDRMAEIHRRIEGRVRGGLATALASLAPHAETDRVELLTELIMAMATGLMCRRIAAPTTDASSVHAAIERIIDSELNALQADRPS